MIPLLRACQCRGPHNHRVMEKLILLSYSDEGTNKKHMADICVLWFHFLHCSASAPAALKSLKLFHTSLKYQRAISSRKDVLAVATRFFILFFTKEINYSFRLGKKNSDMK